MKKPQTIIISARVPRDLAQRIDRVALLEKRKRGNMLEILVEEALDARAQHKKGAA